MAQFSSLAFSRIAVQLAEVPGTTWLRGKVMILYLPQMK